MVLGYFSMFSLLSGPQVVAPQLELDGQQQG